MRRLIPLALAALALGGCAVIPSLPSHAKPLPGAPVDHSARVRIQAARHGFNLAVAKELDL
jgi:hypothetical protein